MKDRWYGEPGYGGHLIIEHPLPPPPVERVETVNHPAYYGGKHNVYEAINVIENWDLDFCLGNAVKYIARAGKKGDAIEDIRKAIWYLERRIMQTENSRALAGGQ